MVKSITVGIKKIHPDAKIPVYISSGASGADVFSVVDKDILPNSYCAIDTGFALEMPHGIEAQIRPRSGIAGKYGVTILNSPGTIDFDYRGEIKILLINHGNTIFKIRKGMRIAQMVFSSVKHIDFKVKDKLDETDRGSGGFGHSDVGCNEKKNEGM